MSSCIICKLAPGSFVFLAGKSLAGLAEQRTGGGRVSGVLARRRRGRCGEKEGAKSYLGVCLLGSGKPDLGVVGGVGGQGGEVCGGGGVPVAGVGR